MIRRVIIGALALFVTVAAVNAQTQFGIKGGYNNSKFATDNDGTTTEGVSGFNAGLVADIGITEMFSIRTGLDVQSKGARLMNNNLTGKVTANPLYLELPVTFNVNFPLGVASSMYAGAGPYLGVGVGGKIKSTEALWGYAKDSDEPIEWGSDNNSDLKRLDAGLNVGGGVKFNNRFGVHVQYGFGLVDVSTDKTELFYNKINNRTFGASGIFYF